MTKDIVNIPLPHRKHHSLALLVLVSVVIPAITVIITLPATSPAGDKPVAADGQERRLTFHVIPLILIVLD